MNACLDQRIIAPGLTVTVADLVAVFESHYRPDTAMTACTACGYRYTNSQPVCASLAVVMPLLDRRRHEAPDAVPWWVIEALKEIHIPAPRRVQPDSIEDAELFDSTPYRVTPVPRQCRSKRALS